MSPFPTRSLSFSQIEYLLKYTHISHYFLNCKLLILNIINIAKVVCYFAIGNLYSIKHPSIVKHVHVSSGSWALFETEKFSALDNNILPLVTPLTELSKSIQLTTSLLYNNVFIGTYDMYKTGPYILWHCTWCLQLMPKSSFDVDTSMPNFNLQNHVKHQSPTADARVPWCVCVHTT